MPSARTRLGARGEASAATDLQERGYQVLGRNYRTRYGEVDLVARDGESIVFVEVRTRRSSAYGLPEESVTARKTQRLVVVAQQYLQEHGLELVPWRVDLVAVSIEGDRTTLEHIRGIAVEEPGPRGM